MLVLDVPQMRASVIVASNESTTIGAPGKARQVGVSVDAGFIQLAQTVGASNGALSDVPDKHNGFVSDQERVEFGGVHLQINDNMLVRNLCGINDLLVLEQIWNLVGCHGALHNVKHIDKPVGVSNKQPIGACAVRLTGDDLGCWKDMADGFGAQINGDDGVGFVNHNQDGKAGLELQVFDAGGLGQTDGR